MLDERATRAVPAVEELEAVARRAGIDVLGIAGAEPFDDTRAVLESRKADGLHGGMQFTYRNPRRSTDPARLVPGARSLLVGARGYGGPEPPGRAADEPPAGRVARYARLDHYAVLRAALEAVAGVLRAEGWIARVACDDNALVDRAAAWRAGLGWYGKSTNLLLPGLGSWFVLGSVVTDAPLPPAPAPVADGCGGCTRCLEGCPTGAIVAPGVVDARRCLAWLVQAPGPLPEAFRVALGDRIYGCDDCQEVCPPNRALDRRRPTGDVGPGRETGNGRPGSRADRRGDQSAQRVVPAPRRRDHAVAAPVPDLSARVLGARVPLLALLEASDEALLDGLGRWYVPERDPRYLRRNALVALGNVGRPGDPAVTRALTGYAEGADPLLAEHARWALERLGERARA